METYIYTLESDSFMLAAAVGLAFHDPKHINKLDPNRLEVIDLDTVHPMLRGSLGKKNYG